MDAHRSLMELPAELQAKIFLSLPVRCLMNCKCVCKTFCTIIQNPNFSNTHFTRNRSISCTDNSEDLILQFDDMSCNTHFLLSIDNSTKIVLSSSPLVPIIPYVGTLSLVGSCNGLVCFLIRTDLFCDDIFLLWNPFTREHRYLPEPLKNNCQIKEFSFIPETNDYVVLRIGSDSRLNIQVEMYKMSKDSWMIVDCSSFIEADFISPDDLYESSVFLNGSFHWGAGGDVNCNYIVCFNLKDEELGLIKTLEHDIVSSDEWDIAMIEESLAVIYWSYNDNFQIWIMKDYGVRDSWQLKFQINNDLFAVGYWESNLLISDDNTLYLYDLDTRERTKIPHSENRNVTGFSSFVGTLAPIRILH